MPGSFIILTRNWQAIYEGCELSPEVIQKILDCEIDLKAADALHLCYAIKNLKGKFRANAENQTR